MIPLFTVTHMFIQETIKENTNTLHCNIKGYYTFTCDKYYNNFSLIDTSEEIM